MANDPERRAELKRLDQIIEDEFGHVDEADSALIPILWQPFPRQAVGSVWEFPKKKPRRKS